MKIVFKQLLKITLIDSWCQLRYRPMLESSGSAAAKMEVGRLISPEVLRQFGCGRRKLTDELFKTDPALPRLGVRDLDDEELCHEVITSTCSIPGCRFTTDSLLEFESHYNSSHRYSCSQCKKVLPSPHLLDLHLQEQHDSFFAVLATRKPSYCCYIEECKEKFMNAKERLQHCVDEHKMPKDFRFDQKSKPKKAKNKIKKQTEENSMDVDGVPEQKQFYFNNTRHKTFAKYTGKKFTTDKQNSSSVTDVNMDEVVNDLKSSLPT